MGNTSKAVAPTVLFCSLKIELDSDRGPVAVPSIVSVIPAPDEIEKRKKQLSTQHIYVFEDGQGVCASPDPPCPKTEFSLLTDCCIVHVVDSRHCMEVSEEARAAPHPQRGAARGASGASEQNVAVGRAQRPGDRHDTREDTDRERERGLSGSRLVAICTHCTWTWTCTCV